MFQRNGGQEDYPMQRVQQRRNQTKSRNLSISWIWSNKTSAHSL